MAKIMIGVAWPYANGTIHLGHLAGSLLPPDIFRRYNSLIGNDVLMVSGSDQHGTPITVTAEKEGTTPLDVAERFHAINKKAIEDMDIDFSLFTKTHTDNHIAVVHRIFLTLLEKKLLYKKETMQYFCKECDRFLPDRYVIGICPTCGKSVKGDQCESCGTTFETGDLKEERCLHCNSVPEIRGTEHFFLRLSEFQDALIQYAENTDWSRSNVETFTKNWMKDGLKDRAVTRDMDWGIPVPVEGWNGKVIYVWFEAVIGYLSASIEFSKLSGDPELWKSYWKDPNVQHYYFLGKDNIPFHSIIWPAILMGCGGLDLPTDIPANEYLNFKGGKLSKSKGGAIDVPSVLKDHDVDVIRYYLSANMPDTHDTEFSWEDLQVKVNNELVSTLGNFYHRCLSFTKKNFDIMPSSSGKDDVSEEIERAFTEYREHMERFDFKKAIRTVMDLARWGNRYFDSVKPWSLIKTDREECGSVLNANMRIVKALTIMAWPFMPSSSERVWKMTGQKKTIEEIGYSGILDPLEFGIPLAEPVPVYKKIDSVPADAEPKKMGGFEKLDIRAGTILDAKDHPDAEKLFVLKVNDSKERQIVAGLKGHYTKEELIGRKVLVVHNLKPAKLRGERSEGMLLAADGQNGEAFLLRPVKNIPDGTRIDCGFGGTAKEIEYKEFQNVVMKVLRVKDGMIRADDLTAKVDTDLSCLAVIVSDELTPMSDGKGCFITIDGVMDDGRVR